jgi:hypothetical protein
MVSVANRSTESSEVRRANVRIALTPASIAVSFFGGIIAAQYTGGTAAGIGVLGLSIVGLLLVALVHGVPN